MPGTVVDRGHPGHDRQRETNHRGRRASPSRRRSRRREGAEHLRGYLSDRRADPSRSPQTPATRKRERSSIEVARHHFRPRRTSNASIATSMFSRPATIRECIAVFIGRGGHPRPAEVESPRDEIGMPMPRFGSDRGEADGGSENTNGEVALRARARWQTSPGARSERSGLFVRRPGIR